MRIEEWERVDHHGPMAAGTSETTMDHPHLGREAALDLLDRSIGYGHGRLAVVRLSVAVHAGAQLERRHWSYCEEVVRRSRDLVLHSLFAGARDQAR
jgi:hypothetical protein